MSAPIDSAASAAGIEAPANAARPQPLQKAGFRCLHRLRVRWAEVDMQKIVFNAHYLMYIDTAMSDYWRGLALPYEAAMPTLGGELYVKKATLQYHASARLDDVLDIGLRCASVGRSSVRFEAGIFSSSGQLLVDGEMIYVFADPATQRPAPVPTVLRDLFSTFEAGDPVVDVELGPWSTLGEAAGPLRQAVFVQEQGVPAALEADALDATALHAVLRNRLGAVVATGRLLQPATGLCRIGRMAVDRTLRGQGWGAAVLDALVEAARARGDQLVELHAQCSAEAFYRRAGFTPVGAPFEEAGLLHVTMERWLAAEGE